MVNLPAKAGTAGIASQWSEDIVVTEGPLLAGNLPAAFTRDYQVAASQTIAAWTPVGLSSGKIVPAVSGTTQAIGVAAVAITTSGSESTRAIPVYIAGCFDADGLTWPASYDTDAKKKAAFDGAASPTQIVVKKRASYVPASA